MIFSINSILLLLHDDDMMDEIFALTFGNGWLGGGGGGLVLTVLEDVHVISIVHIHIMICTCISTFHSEKQKNGHGFR
jgi:hypothetical protein